MRWSVKIGRLTGTEIRIHLSLLLLLLWLGISTWHQGTPVDVLIVLALVCLSFTCVLLHELGHVLMGLRFGITTPRIVLYPIGGVAWMKRIPREPRVELLIALAGPMVNIFLAAIGILVIRGTILIPLRETPASFEEFVAALIWINLALGAFNLIPAFPMDGGRILRALLAMKFSFEKATAIAVRIGEAFGIVFAVYSIIAAQPVLFLISLFLIFSASAEGSVVKREQLLEGLAASDAAIKEFHTLKMQDTIHHAVTLVLDGSQPDFPVVNSAGQCTAIATRNDLIRVLRDQGPNAPVSEAIRDTPAQIHADTSATEAWRRLLESGLPGAAVVDSHGSLCQWLTLENIEELIQTRAATHEFLTNQQG
jgi:stage IV sporulation protein FB